MTDMVTVLVDTTELAESPLLATAAWRELLARGRRGQVEILIPEVAALEAERHYRRKLKKELRDSRRANGRLRALGIEVPPDRLGSQEEDLLRDFRNTFDGLVSGSGGQLLAIPDVPHESLLHRDLAEAKPFSSSGKGYRDALVWHSLLEHVAEFETSSMVFVSANSADFCGDEGRLAPELLDEIAAVDSKCEVRYVSSISTVVEELRLAHAEEDELLYEEGIDQPTVDELVTDAVSTGAEGLLGTGLSDLEGLDSQLSDVYRAIVPDGVEDVTVESVQVRSGSTDFTVYERYDGDTLAITASVDAEMTFEGFMYKGDLAASEADIYLIDDDWNDHMALVGFDAELRLTFQILVVGEQLENIEFGSCEAL